MKKWHIGVLTTQIPEMTDVDSDESSWIAENCSLLEGKNKSLESLKQEVDDLHHRTSSAISVIFKVQVIALKLMDGIVSLVCQIEGSFLIYK